MNEGLKGFGMTCGWVINDSYYPFKINSIRKTIFGWKPRSSENVNRSWKPKSCKIHNVPLKIMEFLKNVNARSAVVAYSYAYILVCCALVWVSLKIFSAVRLLWCESHSLWPTIRRRVCQRVCALVFVSIMCIMCIELEKIKVIRFKFQIITFYNLLWLSMQIGLSLSFV